MSTFSELQTSSRAEIVKLDNQIMQSKMVDREYPGNTLVLQVRRNQRKQLKAFRDVYRSIVEAVA